MAGGGGVMTPGQIERLFAALMGKCQHVFNGTSLKCEKCGAEYFKEERFNPSPDGEHIDWPVMKFMAEKLPDAWEGYLEHIDRDILDGPYPQYADMLNLQLSITNLTQYIMDNYKAMFFEECPKCRGTKQQVYACRFSMCTLVTCEDCNGTGKVVKREFAEVVKVIEEMKEDN
jgi:hypothetical protein